MKKSTRTLVLDLLAAEPDITGTEIARRLGVSRQRVHQILKGAGKAGKNTGSAMGYRTEYQCWSNLIARCIDQDHKLYPYYGGRGIRVCDRWLNSFPAFLSDMGPKPSPELSIDRINNDGNYEPSNCRWATRSQQINNRRAARLVRKLRPKREPLPPGREWALTPAQRKEVAAAVKAGEKPGAIAKRFGISRASVYNYSRPKK